LAGACAWAAEEWTYTVRPGDTLWGFSDRYLTAPALATRLQKHNALPDARRLQPGTTLRVPLAWTRHRPTLVRLLAVRGTVRSEGGATGARTLRVQDEVGPGEVLTTPPDGHALLQFEDGSRLSLLADSALRILSARAYAGGLSETRLELLRGRTENDVVPRTGQGVRFEILTPAGVTSVRGTEYRVSTEQGAATRLEVLDGAVEAGGDAGAVTVPAGFGTRFAPGEAPRAPVQLMPAPDLSGVPARVEALPAELALAPLAGARAYRVQLAGAAADATVVLDVLETAPRLRIPPLAPGRYILSVRGIDDIGLEGRNARQPIEVSAAPAPPEALTPGTGENVGDSGVALSWRAQPGMTHRVQVARDAAFTELVRDVAGITAATLVLDDLPAGVYHWRIAAAHPQHGAGPFGAARSFRRDPRAPADLAASVDQAMLDLRWTSTEPQARFRVELARDEAFADPVLDRVVEATQLRVPPPVPGEYLARVRVVAADGHAGPPGEPLRVSVPAPPSPPLLVEPADAYAVDAESIRAVPLTLRWQPRSGERYAIRLAKEGESGAPAFLREGVEVGSVRVEGSLAPGRYLWQVAASTEDGGAGEFSTPRRLHVAPAAPMLEPPAADGRAVRLSWRAPTGAVGYRVQVARDAQFGEVIRDEHVGEPQWRVAELPRGTYHARVQALDAGGLAGAYSPAQAFEVPRRFPWWMLPVLPLLLLLP